MRGSRRSISWNDLPAVVRARVKQASPAFATLEEKPKKQKYSAVPVTDWRGVLYDSKAEKEWAERLDMMVATGRIKRWSYGPRFLIQGPTLERPDIPRITYRPDFLVWDNDCYWWALDAKGMVTREFSRMAKLWKALYPRNLLRVGFKDGSMKEIT